MVTVADMIREITKKLRAQFPVEYKDVDITEGFARPCLTIEVGDITSGFVDELLLEDTVPIRVYYFAPRLHDGYMQLLQMQSELRLFFARPLEIASGFYIFTEEMDFSINKDDKSLILTMEFYMVQDRRAIPAVMYPDQMQPQGEFASDEPIEELIARIEQEFETM